MNNLSDFHEIDYENWNRKDIYDEYKGIAFFVTIDVDVTHYVEFYKHHIKFYPFMNYVVSRVANSNKEYRMCVRDGKVGYYDMVHPFYTLLRSNQLFTHMYTMYNEDFVTFYHDFQRDKKIGESLSTLYPEGGRPKGVICTSTMPNSIFSEISFTYADMSGITEYIPFSTFGKITEKGGRWYCPVATQFFHGVNDGYHAEQYYKAMQDIIDNFDVDLDRI